MIDRLSDNFNNALNSPPVDFLCIFPFIQQAMGGVQVLFNLTLAVSTIANGIFHRTWHNAGHDLYDRLNEERDPNKREGLKIKILSFPGYRFQIHMNSLAIGLYRVMPIVGTLFSLASLLGWADSLKKDRPVLMDPRPGIHST